MEKYLRDVAYNFQSSCLKQQEWNILFLTFMPDPQYTSSYEWFW